MESPTSYLFSPKGLKLRLVDTAAGGWLAARERHASEDLGRVVPGVMKQPLLTC